MPSPAVARSLNQHLVEFIEQRLEPIPEQLVRPAEAALLRERQAPQVVGRDFHAGQSTGISQHSAG